MGDNIVDVTVQIPEMPAFEYAGTLGAHLHAVFDKAYGVDDCTVPLAVRFRRRSASIRTALAIALRRDRP